MTLVASSQLTRFALERNDGHRSGSGRSECRQSRRRASIQQRFGAKFLQGGEITLAAQTTDTDLIQPLLDEYSADTGVTINTAPAPYGDLYAQLNIALTQASGAYDVVSLDDPWMPQFAGGQFLMNIQKTARRARRDPGCRFHSAISGTRRLSAGTGLRGIPWVGNVQVLARSEPMCSKKWARPFLQPGTMCSLAT